jgi:hypothetical protein
MGDVWWNARCRQLLATSVSAEALVASLKFAGAAMEGVINTDPFALACMAPSQSAIPSAT